MLKNIFTNILFLYKNIFHWNISKILISISSYLLGIILSLPFFSLLLLIIYFSPFYLIDLLNGKIQLSELLSHLIWSLFIIISFLSGIITIFLGIFYSKILLIKLNLKYLKKKKLKFKNNNYFNLKLFIKTSKISAIIFGYLFILFFIFLLFSIISYFIFGGGTLGIEAFKNSDNFKIFSGIILFYVIIFSGIGLLLLYRTYFSYYILVENKEITAKQCINKSIKLTKSTRNIIKFILINIVLLLLYFPFSYIQQSIDKSSNILNYYINLKNKKSLNINFIVKGKINEELDYSILKNKYKKYSNTELIGKSRFLFFLQIFYFIFNFIFIYGILDFIYAHFYKKTLNK